MILSQLFEVRRNVVDPRLHPKETFYYYNMPAFDENGQPELVRGSQIDSAKFIVDPGTVLISKLNPRIKRVWHVRNDGLFRSICSTEFVNVVPRKPATTDFLFQLLRSEGVYRLLERNAEGTTNSHVRFKPGFLGQIQLDEIAEEGSWSSIASILNTLDFQLEQTEALIAKYQQIKAGLMHDLFTRGVTPDGHLRPTRAQAPHLYKESPLGWIPKEWSSGLLSDFLLGGPKNGYSPQEVDEWSGLYTLGLGCLTTDGFRPNHLKMVALGSSACHDALLQDGDFLLSRSNTRELVGLCGIYRDVGCPCIYPDLMMRIRPNGKTSTQFLEALLLSPLMRVRITSAAVGTSGSMVKLNSRSVLRLQLAMPEKDEQAHILNLIHAQRDTLMSLECDLAKLRQQRQGLMHDLLTGRVRVKVAKAEEKL